MICKCFHILHKTTNKNIFVGLVLAEGKIASLTNFLIKIQQGYGFSYNFE